MPVLIWEIIDWYQWDILSIRQGIINRVDKVARNKGQLLVANKFRYKWYPGVDIDDGGDVEEVAIRSYIYANIAPMEIAHDDRDELDIGDEKVANEATIDEKLKWQLCTRGGGNRDRKSVV